MSISIIHSKRAPRALASVVFACGSISLMPVADQARWLALHVDTHGMPQPANRYLPDMVSRLDVVWAALAVAALIWCVLSWRAEWRTAAFVSSLFTGAALVCLCVSML